jgi:hypothetical protein
MIYSGFAEKKPDETEEEYQERLNNDRLFLVAYYANARRLKQRREARRQSNLDTPRAVPPAPYYDR